MKPGVYLFPLLFKDVIFFSAARDSLFFLVVRFLLTSRRHGVSPGALPSRDNGRRDQKCVTIFEQCLRAVAVRDGVKEQRSFLERDEER